GMEPDSDEFGADDSGAIERNSLADSSDSTHHSDGDRLDVRIADLGNDSDVLRPVTTRFSNTTTPSARNESNRTDVRGDRHTNQAGSNRSNNDSNRAVQSPSNQRSGANTNPRSPVLQMETNTTLRTEETADNRQTPTGNRESTPPTGSERLLTLQMGAFSDQSSADRMAATLREQGFEPRVEKISGKWVVRLGRSQTRRGLWGLDARLREKNYRPILRQE
ncbi:MAG: SPOR domain-containing protein, partial [Leptospiraceae bacterium]|nr:SPOR domain-containing protein [Leptospiraceae bacterium]